MLSNNSMCFYPASGLAMVKGALCKWISPLDVIDLHCTYTKTKTLFLFFNQGWLHFCSFILTTFINLTVQLLQKKTKKSLWSILGYFMDIYSASFSSSLFIQYEFHKGLRLSFHIAPLNILAANNFIIISLMHIFRFPLLSTKNIPSVLN